MSSDPCKALRDQINGLESMVESLQAELRTASPSMKPGLIRMIRDTRLEIGDLREELRTCEQTNPQPQPSENVVLTTDTCPICSSDQERIWERVALDQLGVDGTDVDGHWVGGFPAERFGILNINNWYPLAVEKRVLCGVLHHFNFYDGYGDEADWNNFVIPNPAFSHLLEDAKIHGATDEWHDCNGTQDCMEAEITPDESYYENIFNSRSLDESVLEGQVVCTYGTWIRERVHGNRPEIHPSEMYWWRGELPNGEFAYTLMMVQDDSNRFDRENNYDFGAPWDDPPSGWRPWSENPRTNRFRIAFELNPAAGPLASGPLTFRIRRLESLRVQERWGDATPGAEHALEYNGRVVLRIEELLPNEGHVGVTFGSVCRNAANNRLQGYVVLTATVGVGDRGGEGYQTLQVNVTQPPFVLDPFRGDWPVLATMERRRLPFTIQTIARPETLRRIEVDGQPQLAGDVELRVQRPPDAPLEDIDLSITSADLVTGRGRSRLRHQPISRSPRLREQRAIVSDVAVTGGARLEVAVGTGDVATLEVPDLAIVPRVIQERPQQTSAAPDAWSAIATAAGATTTNGTPAVAVTKVQSWQIEAAPEYAPVRAGQPSAEDDSPFVDELNRIVRSGDTSRINELFGSARMVSTDWTFEAVNLTTGNSVQVHEGQGALPEQVQVEVGPDTGVNANVSVIFPQQPAGAIIEVTATVRMRDTFGVEGEVQHRLTSHVLTADNPRELARSMVTTAASLAGIEPNNLATAADLGGPTIDDINDDPRVPDARSSRAAMVRLMALAASEDGRVTVDELGGLVRGARAFGNTP